MKDIEMNENVNNEKDDRIENWKNQINMIL